jgi:CRP-like cAMP-binding protein
METETNKEPEVRPMSQRRKSPVQPENIEPEMCSLDLRLQILHGLPFFAGLSHDDVHKINASFQDRGYRRGATIFFAGDAVNRLYVVAVGKVKLMRHTLSGQEILLDILTPGEFFGNLAAPDNAMNLDTAIAQTTLCLLSIETDDFRQIMTSYPSVALAVLSLTDERLNAAHEKIQQLSALVALAVLSLTDERLNAAHEKIQQLSACSVEQRIVHTLLKLAEKLGEPHEVGLLIQMPLAREDLAAMAGTTTESASRTLSQLQKDGMIATGRQWVAIVDQPGLRALVEDATG